MISSQRDVGRKVVQTQKSPSSQPFSRTSRPEPSVGYFCTVRRLMSFIPIGVLTCLTVAAMALSLNTTPRAAYFATPRPGKPAVVKELHTALLATLKAPSFQYRSGIDVTDYQAPDRTEGVGPLGNIVIGHTAYLALSADGSTVTQWGEGPLVRAIDLIAGPASVRLSLKELLTQTSVTLHAGVFTAREVVPADEVEPELTGQVLVVTTVRVDNGYVVSVHPVVHGFIPSFVNLPGGRVKSITARSLSGQTETYSKFGRVPPISAPRRNVIRLHPCPDGDVMHVSGSHVCGL